MRERERRKIRLSVLVFVLYTQSIEKHHFFKIIIVHFLTVLPWTGCCCCAAADARGGVNGRPLFRPPY